MPLSHPVWFGPMHSFDSVLALVSPAAGAAVLREGGRLRAMTEGRLYVGATVGTSPAAVEELIEGHCDACGPVDGRWDEIPEEGLEEDCLVILGRPTENEKDILSQPSLRTVLDTMPCSVFVMDPDTCPDTVERILVPVEASTSSARSLRYAQELAGAYDARVILLHVVDDNPYVALTRRDRLSMSRTALPEHRARRRLRKWVKAQSEADRDLELVVRSGVPAREIRDVFVQQDMDLLVLPVTGEQVSDGPPVDEQAARVMRHLSGPVVLVPPGR